MGIKGNHPLAAAALAFALVSSPAAAEEMRILAPYVGILSNVYKDDDHGLDLRDSGLLTGLYFQWIDTERYQWNAFLYYAPEVNYTRVLGGHFIYDRYLGPDWHGKFVVGAGLEAMHNELDAGSNIEGLSAFDMDYWVWTPYFRTGKYFKAELGPAAFSLLPWVGVEPEWIRGDMSQTVPAHPPYMPSEINTTASLDDYRFYGIAGLNFKVNLYRFVDLETKYKATFDKADLYGTVDAVANVFFTRSLGLSYRFKYMQSLDGTGSNSYHYFGLAYLF